MKPKTTNVSILGAIVAAFGAGLCCAGPLILLMLGISGSWIATLTLFEPYRPLFILLVVSLLSWSAWTLYWPQVACDDGTSCAQPIVQSRRKILFWLGVITATIFVTSNTWVLWVI
ncbi:MAG: mercury transporter [Oceanospirillaceae bacterium]|nr:mercury transporter [Oceanospirillaceae bacterium]